MKRLVFAVSMLTLGLSAATAARADYGVVMFKDGTCRVWNETKMTPVQPGYKYHWTGLKSWDYAKTKKHYAMTHHWCKTFAEW
jgi:hypothetical protein